MTEEATDHNVSMLRLLINFYSFTLTIYALVLALSCTRSISRIKKFGKASKNSTNFITPTIVLIVTNKNEIISGHGVRQLSSLL